MKIKKDLLFLVTLVVTGLFFSNTALGSDTIKIGVAGAHSGDLASYGIPTVNAVELLTSKLNSAGGINGKKIEVK